jgi:predicted HAD superfamily Cof-like phosphohydrolase
MDQLDALDQVAEFHQTFKHPIEPQPIIPAPERCRLRLALLEEELKELRQAIEDGNLVEVADAFCDLQYVLSGAILEFGMGEKFRALFDEVQRSNMSKVCHSPAEAEETIAYYAENRGVEAYYVESNGHYLVYRKDDNKTLKSVRYSPADLAAILAQ